MQRVIAFMRENVRVNKTINVCSSAYHQWTCSLKKNSMHIQIWQMLAEIMTKISCYQIKYQTIHNFYFEFMTKIVSALDRSKQTGSRRNQSQKKNQLNFPILSEPQCMHKKSLFSRRLRISIDSLKVCNGDGFYFSWYKSLEWIYLDNFKYFSKRHLCAMVGECRNTQFLVKKSSRKFYRDMNTVP